MRRVLLLLFMLICCTTMLCRAEGSDTVATNYLISIHPLQMLARGIKSEVEAKIPGSHLSLAVSPEIYYGDIKAAKDNIMVNANRDNISVFGLGACGTGRYFIGSRLHHENKSNPVANFYLLGSLEFRWFDLDYKGKAWVLVRENGIDIYRLLDANQNNSIVRIGANVGIGALFFFGKDFFCDFSLYQRISKAYQHQSTQENAPFADDFFTLTGNSVGFGFRLGLLLD